MATSASIRGKPKLDIQLCLSISLDKTVQETNHYDLKKQKQQQQQQPAPTFSINTAQINAQTSATRHSQKPTHFTQRIHLMST